MAEGYGNIQYEEVVTAQDLTEEDQFHVSSVSNEFEEAIYEIEIEEELIYEESLPVYEEVTAYEEIIENTNTAQHIHLENQDYTNQESDNIREAVFSNSDKALRVNNKFSELNNAVKSKITKAKPLRLLNSSITGPKPRTFEKNKKRSPLKNIPHTIK